MIMLCPKCKQELKKVEHGAYLNCCGVLGYYSDLKPLAKDNWYPIRKVKGLYLYKGCK